MKKIIVFTTLLIVISLKLLAQQATVSIKGDSLKLKDIIGELEKISSKHFFYNEMWGDTILFDLNITEKTVDETLEIILEQSKINYYEVSPNNIVLTYDYKIKSNYGENFKKYLNKLIVQKDTVEYKLPDWKKQEKESINQEYQNHRIGNPSKNKDLRIATLSGTVKNLETGESLIGAVIYFNELEKGCVTNSSGAYSITIPKGQYRVEYRSMGMRTAHRNITIYSDGKLDVGLQDQPTTLNEVTINGDTENKVKNLRMGVERVEIKSLKRLPAGFGEADIIKGALQLPGVQSVGEAAAGFNVRGGSTDQNLILLSGVPIMNTSHFFGFFSGFNADIIQDVTLLKSSIPAKYGGRASAVMDIELKDGNRKELHLSGGISPVSGRLTIDSPIKKDKSSFIIGVRSTYSNWVLGLFDDVKLKNSKADFYDIQGNFSFDLNEQNKLYLSGYKSHDFFNYYTEDAITYNTVATSAKLHHTFNPKFIAVFTGTYSHFDFALEAQQDSTLQSEVIYALNQYGFKSDFSYHTYSSHKIEFGLQGKWYRLYPGERTPVGNASQIVPKNLESEQALETSVYVSDEFDVSHFLSVSAGIRYTFYGSFGAKTQTNYLSGYPRQTENIDGSTYYKSGELLKSYAYPEFRFGANFLLSDLTSIKVGVSRMYQYIQMISNTATMSPTDIWKLSDNYIKPLRSDQYSLGFYHQLNQTYEFTAEAYYKDLINIIDYKGGAQLLMNEHLETDVLNGKGKAYGAELMLEKKKGKFTGWINYTYSRIFHKIETEFEEEQVNDGDYFPANYDKPHNLNITTNYKASRRFNLSTSFFYNSGRPFTAPVAYYEYNNAIRPFYSKRNALRMENYIRWDIAATLHGNLVRKKLNHSSWTFAVYNVLGRKNPYSVYFRTEGNVVNGYKMSIYGQPIFTITYNFKILGNAKDDF